MWNNATCLWYSNLWRHACLRQKVSNVSTSNDPDSNALPVCGGVGGRACVCDSVHPLAWSCACVCVGMKGWADTAAASQLWSHLVWSSSQRTLQFSWPTSATRRSSTNSLYPSAKHLWSRLCLRTFPRSLTLPRKHTHAHTQAQRRKFNSLVVIVVPRKCCCHITGRIWFILSFSQQAASCC